MSASGTKRDRVPPCNFIANLVSLIIMAKNPSDSEKLKDLEDSLALHEDAEMADDLTLVEIAFGRG